MTIAKRPGGGYQVKHCHGKDKGKPITKKRLSKEKAEAVHQAIQANKHKK